ncbi:bicarbonate transporter [Chloropicon primus]|nr:bicarbonate transporter [Chloropicon primus]UPQ97645.1 bicarbonate transporter [Chloropicon primus]|eukprot:QDZ18435.1 bicarbonate transporter [Chloropicon primus]
MAATTTTRTTMLVTTSRSSPPGRSSTSRRRAPASSRGGVQVQAPPRHASRPGASVGRRDGRAPGRVRASAAAEEIPESELSIVETPFVGLKRDLKQRLPFYVSDYTEGLNLKCLASTLFMFFACLAPAVAFGSLLNVKTQGAMGALEMLVSTSICGMVYALFSGQPVTIIGSTGPVLAFTAIMYSTCQQMALPFLSTYAWVGLWTSGILGLCAVTSTSNLVIRYLTRFTDEIFAGLISVIFVVEAMKNIVSLLFNSGVSSSAALLSIMTAISTCAFALSLAGLRSSSYFNKKARDLVANFGPTISIVACTIACTWLATRYGIGLEYLTLPSQIAPSTPRPWVVSLMDTPVWARWASSLPAVMVSILMFFDQNITTRLVNSKDNKMKKGYGYHVDLLIVAANTLVFSMLGMPWLVAATVRSVNHLKSLTTFEDVKEGDVETTKVVGVTETRVTNFAIHACIGASVLYARDLLAKIPQCVLMGLFLYLGLSAIKGNEFLERIELFFMDKKKMPKVPYVTDISLGATKKFTLLQIASLLALVALKESKYGILFPVVIAALQIILVLAVRAKWFTEKEIAVLDRE